MRRNENESGELGEIYTVRFGSDARGGRKSCLSVFPRQPLFAATHSSAQQKLFLLTRSLALATFVAAFALLAPSTAALKLGPYIAPGATDNRGPCPGFNTMANHGVFPRDGSAIPRKRIVQAFRKFYSFSPTVTKALINGAFSAGVGDRKAGTIDLVQLRAHNKLEHDVSLVSDDYYLGNNYLVNKTLFNQMLDFSSTKKYITLREIGRFRKHRFYGSHKNNPQLSYNTKQEAVAFSEAAALAGVFGGRLRFYAVPINYLKSFLRDHRYPKGFKPPLVPLSFPELLAVAARIKVAAFFA
ncbi:unnamed protein product [Closterium sp. NIES-64]|nr:unnamed protein product [Closterium sp. NIES-64]